MEPPHSVPDKSLPRRAVALAVAQVLLLSSAMGCKGTFYRTFEWIPLPKNDIKALDILPKEIRVTWTDGKTVHLRNAKTDYQRLTGTTAEGDTRTVELKEAMRIEFKSEVMKYSPWSPKLTKILTGIGIAILCVITGIGLLALLLNQPGMRNNNYLR